LIEVDRAKPVPYEFLVDVNAAEWPELAQLPEIGEVLARRIVETRDQRGPFRTQDELLEVDGIGRVKLSRMAPHLLPLPDEGAMVGN
jgi:competence protein ComEA